MQIQKNVFSIGKKLTNIPKHLIYQRRKFQQLEGDAVELVAFTTGKNKAKAEMIYSKRNMEYLTGFKDKGIWVNYIGSSKSGTGLGTALIDFAKNQAKKQSLNGCVFLSADWSFTPHRAPHLFYRKLGFESLFNSYNKKMDKFIKQGKCATYKDFPRLTMIYNPNKQSEKSGIKNFFSHLTRIIKSFYYL